MVDEDPKNKKMRFIEAYLDQREEEHQKVYSQPASTRPVEPAMAYPWSKPIPKTERPSNERISVRDLAMKRARPYLRPDQETQEEQKPAPEPRMPSLIAKRSPGFKLVKEGADSVPGQTDAKRKRLCLYDLYAPRVPAEQCEPVPKEEPHDEPPVEPEEEPEEEPEAPVSQEERAEIAEEAESLLWGGKKKKAPVKEHPAEKPILKVGPAKAIPREEPTEPVAPPHEEPKEVEEEAPPHPAAETPDAKTEGGEFCASCGSKISDANVPQICTGCGSVRCVKCNNYDQEHLRTSIYYDYQFDWPLCVGCYSKAFNIQKTLAKAQTCFANGNLTYAVYYAQNALKMDPSSRYAELAAKLIQRVDEAKVKKEAMDKAWRNQSERIMRAKYQDPGWKKGS